MNCYIRIAVIITLVTLPKLGIGQYNLEWTNFINGNSDTTEYIDDFYDQLITQSDSGYIYAAGNTVVGNSQDLIISKVNSSGNLIWTVQFDNGAQSADYVNAIYVDSSENVYVLASKKNSSVDWDIQLIKFDPMGNQNWVYEFTSSLGNGIDIGSELIYDSSSGTFVICGISAQTTYNYLVLRISQTGNILDTFIYNGGTGNYGYPNHCKVNHYGEIYVTGQYKNTSDNSDDGLLIKLDTSLNPIWIRTHGGNNGGGDYFYDLTIDDNGFPIVVGNENQGTSNESFLILKYDTSGTLIWSDTYSAPFYYSGTFRSVAVDEQGSIYAIGESDSATVTNMNTIKYSANGSIIWAKSYCGVGMSLCSANDLSYSAGLVSSYGYSVSPTNGIIALYDTSGVLVWLHESSTAGGDGAYFSGILDSLGQIYVSGIAYNPSTGNNDLWVQKFAPITLSTQESANSLVLVYPNPSSGVVHFTFPVDSYDIFDITGKLVKSENGSDINKIDLSELVVGMYLIKLSTNTVIRVSKVE
jgi:hypothetical protein